MQKAMERSKSRFSNGSEEMAQQLFRNFRRSVAEIPEGSEAFNPKASLSSGSKTRKMKAEGLRKLLAEVDDALFKFIFRLFDPQ